MAKKVFSTIQMLSDDVNQFIVPGKYYDGGDYAEIHDGAVVTIGELDDSTIYPNEKDYNVRKIQKPTASTDAVAIVDISDVTSGKIAGVLYRDGIKATDLVAPEGMAVRVRRLAVGDTFWLASGNFATAPTVGEYAETTANSTVFTPAGSITAGTTTVRIEMQKNLVEGTVNTDTKYFCTVVALA